MRGKFLKNLLIWIALLTIITAGVYLRMLKPDFYNAKTANVIAYYFYKAEYLNNFGHLPEKDIWSFAPAVFPENIPPLLAYATVGSYKILGVFSNSVSFYNFASFFPVLIYIFWSLIGFFVLRWLFKSDIQGLVLTGLLAVMPLSFEITKFGRYNEEALGAFLFFLALAFLIQFTMNRKKIFFWLTIISATALFLTWQQFPIFIAGVFVLGIVQFFKAKENRLKLLADYFLIVSLPLIIGHVISVYLIKIDYSPFSMLYETYFGTVNFNNEFIKRAMSRQDWENLNIFQFIMLVGLAGWILAAGGFLKSLLNLKNLKYFTSALFFVLTLAVAVIFIKSRFLFLAPLLLTACLGVEFLTEKSQGDWLRLANFLGKLKIIYSRYASIAIIVVSLTALGILIFFLFRKNSIEYPEPVINVMYELQKGSEKEYIVEMKLTNGGEDSLQDLSSFGGLHIEVENAEVKNIVTWADNGESAVAIKPDAQRRNIYWFEAKYKSFKKGELGYLWFKVIPKEEPINIYYRGWLPGEPTFWQRITTMLTLKPEWGTWKDSWRSEKAIQRAPTNNDLNYDSCQAKVFAAHEEQQNFWCFKETLP